ncbi:MAG: hypothetical protein ABIY35_07545 [Chitinophagaceae bacterium]
MKLAFCALLILLIPAFSECQFYYNDVITTKQTNDQYALLIKNKIHFVSAKSFEANETQSADFKLDQSISKDGKTIVTSSASLNTGNTISTAFYENKQLVKTMDSSDNIHSTTLYEYDVNNNIARISTITTDNFMNSKSSETHVWTYEDNLPVNMVLIKNGNDTTYIQFEKDDREIATETWKKSGRTVEKYYYYYNNSGMITDIVRYNTKAQQMLPDFTFDYDAQNRVTTFTQIRSSAANYFTWLYEYLPNGLKDRESCFDKQKLPVGKIIFYYQTF